VKGPPGFRSPPTERIPNFEEATETLRRSSRTPELLRARVVKVNPDATQCPARAEVLPSDRTLGMMAVARLPDPPCFLQRVHGGAPEAFHSRGTLERGNPRPCWRCPL
jgi:hypothetical protein